MENIGLWPECNAIIDEIKTKPVKRVRKSTLLILTQGPKRRAGLASEREAKSLDENLDEVSAWKCRGGTGSFIVGTDTTTLLFIDLSFGSPLRLENSLLVVGVRGEFVRQIFVDGRLTKFALVSKLNGFNTLGN